MSQMRRQHVILVFVASVLLAQMVHAGEPLFLKFETQNGQAVAPEPLSTLYGAIDNLGADAPSAVPWPGTAARSSLALVGGTASLGAGAAGTAINTNDAVAYVAYANPSVPARPAWMMGNAGLYALYNPDQIDFDVDTNIPANSAVAEVTIEGYFCAIDPTGTRQVLAIQPRDHRWHAARIWVAVEAGTMTGYVGGTKRITSSAIVAKQWYHFAITYVAGAGAGGLGQTTLYLDGVAQGAWDATVAAGTADFTVAGSGYDGTYGHHQGFQGWTDEYRIYGRRLDPSDFLINGGTSVTGLIWHSRFETEGTAAVTDGQIVTETAEKIDNSAPTLAKPSYAAYADAAVPDMNPSLDPGSQAGAFGVANPDSDMFYINTNLAGDAAPDITAEGYFYPTLSPMTPKQTLFTQPRDTDATHGRISVYLEYDSTANGGAGADTLHAVIGAGTAYIHGSTPVSTNQWHHFAATMTSSGVVKLYLDGQLEGNITSAAAPGSGNMTVAGKAFRGWADCLRVYARVLQSSEFLTAGGKTTNLLLWQYGFETEGGAAIAHGQTLSAASRMIDNSATTGLQAVTYQAYGDAQVPDMPSGIDPRGVAGGHAVHNVGQNDFRIDTAVNGAVAPDDLTMEGYFALESLTLANIGTGGILVMQPRDASWNPRLWIGVNDGGDGTGLHLKAVGFGPVVGATTITGTTALVAGQWYHFALVADHQIDGDTASPYDIRMYLNGALEAEALAVPLSVMSGVGNFHIGNRSPDATGESDLAFQPGWIDAVRISLGALTPAEFLTTAGAQSKGLWFSSFETETATPVSGGQQVSTVAGAMDNLAPPHPRVYGGQAVEVNGNASYVRYADEAVPDVPVSVDPARVTGAFALLNPDKGDQGNFRVSTLAAGNWGNLASEITMEGFFNLQEDLSWLTTTNVVARRFIIQKRSDTDWKLLRLAVGLGYDAANSRSALGVTYMTSDGLAHDLLGATPVLSNEWHHFAVTVKRDTVAGTDDIRFYLDGVEEGSALGLPNLAPAASKPFTVGDVAANLAFKGYSDAYRVTDRALLPSEFLNTGTAALTPDFDANGVVGGSDFLFLAACATGPAAGPPSTEDCRKADLDSDNDVDMDDFGMFQRCYGLTGSPVDPACME